MLALPTRKRILCRGFTLTELAIVLGIIGIIIGGIWEAASNVKKNNDASQAAQDIMTIAANIRSSFTGANSFNKNPNYTATTDMITAGDVPVDLLVPGSTTTLTNTWGGPVVIYENVVSCTLAGVNSARVFRVSYYGVPYDACIRIANQLTSLGTNDGPFQLMTNECGYTLPIPSAAHPVAGASLAPPTAASIANACAQNNGSANNSVEFDFMIH